MMVLHPGSATETQVARRPMQRPVFMRRRSKGTIASYTDGEPVPSGPPMGTLNGGLQNGPVTGAQVNPSAPGSPNQPQSNAEANPSPSRPCHAAPIVAMCIQNTLKLGARTQLGLCPPGRARRRLREHLQELARKRASPGKLVATFEVGGYYGLDKMVGPNFMEEYEEEEAEFLINTNTFDADSDEEASSGDEDDLEDFDDLFSEEPIPVEEDRYLNLREPLYSPAGAESSLSNPNGAMSSGGGVPGKLPFNRRKIRFFDLTSAEDKKIARVYLENEMRRSRMRASLVLSRHLRRVQREELRRKRLEEGRPVDDLVDADRETPQEKALLAGVKQLSVPMTPAVASALLIESLSLGSVESVEGMGKCYDGIVNAGVALLEAQSIDPTKPASSDDKVRATSADVMAALAPLLVTSLEQQSGEVILLLAKLRRMCGTRRYQRRFVQRIAPSLVRPPRGAMWCLRHQNDMEAILAACELILDSAFEIFSKGWYERGRLMLADSKRAETLDSAAEQLRNLSSEPTDGLARGLSAGPRRRLVGGAKKLNKDGKGGDKPLAEWEVIAVDREIRLAISRIFTNNWSRGPLHQETFRSLGRRGGAISRRNINSVLPSPNAEMSPKAMPSSPQRGGSGLPARGPHSPPHMPHGHGSSQPQPNSEAFENVFGPAFANQPLSNAERPHSPPPSSPPVPQRSASRDYTDPKSQQDDSMSLPDRPHTHAPPPLSPRSPMHDTDFPQPDSNVSRPSVSPKQAKARPRDPSGASSLPGDGPVPSSPSSSSIGNSSSLEMSSFRISGAHSSGLSSSASTSTPTTQYRTLTSSAAERKRTVAACRALRAQIQRFEDAFVQLHGRPPKGASERAPLATTYAQYREWKRAIRADAACRIQALLRGARTRLILLRSGDSDITHVVLRRAGRPGSSPDLAIPAEIGRSGIIPAVSATSSADSGYNRNSSTSLSPGWTSRQQMRTKINEDRSSPELIGPGPSQSVPSPSRMSPPGVPAEFAGMNLRDLQARKRDLKQQLKQYDMNFFRRNGRMPVKAEKEPIRHLYESYNNLKSHITMMEQEVNGFSSPGTASPSSSTARAVSPPSGSESNDESPARDSSQSSRSISRKLPRKESPPVTASMSSSTISQDLAALKTEKQELHQMLRSYEKDFLRKNGRQVSSFVDIRPVAPQYRRYKEIKKAIAALAKDLQKEK